MEKVDPKSVVLDIVFEQACQFAREDLGRELTGEEIAELAKKCLALTIKNWAKRQQGVMND